MPRRYDPTRSYPLVVAMHGAIGQPGIDFLWMKWGLKGTPIQDEAIGIISRGPKSGFHSVAGVIAAIRKTLQETSAHPNFILLICYSNSGQTNRKILQLYPGLFTANYCYATIPPPLSLCQRLPMYISCGEKDGWFPRVSEAVANLKKHPDMTWAPIQNRTHNFEVKDVPGAVFPWFLRRTLDFKKFEKQIDLKGTMFFRNAGFVRLVTTARSGTFTCKGRVDDNVLSLEIKPSSAVKTLRVYLPPDTFDLTSEIEVKLNRRSRKIPAEANQAAVALESAAFFRQPGKVCGRAVTLRP